jgi:hypothetical protein
MTPQIDSNYNGSSAKVVGAVALDAGKPFGTTPVLTFGRDAFLVYSIPGGVSTFTFNRPYQGLFEVQVTGTVLTDLIFAGTATFSEDGSATNTAATATIGSCIVSALAGQTFSIEIGATTITSAIMRVGDYGYSLG